MKKISFAFACLLCCLQAGAQTNITGGTVNGTWTKAGSPYRIQGDINIQHNDSLIIESGVVVDFEGHYRFKVEGELKALGAPDDSIRFTRVINGDPLFSPDTVGFADTSNYDGSWRGIEWETYTSAVSMLSHCIFEFISTVDNKETSFYDHLAPVQYRGDGTLYLDHSTVRYNQGSICGGMMARNRVMIDSCLFRNNTAWGSMVTNLTSAGGLEIGFSEQSEVTNSVIINNHTYSPGAGGGMRIHAGSPLIMNNFISNNTSHRLNTVSAGGILCSVAFPRIIQNLIVNNESGHASGIYYAAGGGKLYNNTISNNYSHRIGGTGIYFEGASGVIATNNILYGNLGVTEDVQIFLSSLSSQPVVRNNLISTGMDAVRGYDNGAIKESENLFGDPSFASPTGFTGTGPLSDPADWQLSSGSFLINEGNAEAVNDLSIEKDIAGGPRINYGNVDLGCYEFHIVSYTPPATVSTPEIWIADTVRIIQETRLEAKVTIYPGVVILFNGNHNIYAWDSLYAIGIPGAPILFTIDDTSGFSDPASDAGGWGHIDCQLYAPRVFKHCIFEFGKVLKTVDEERGLITGRSNGNVHVESCIFRDCYSIGASIVYTFSGPNYTVKGCTFYNNKLTGTTALINLQNGSNFLVRDNIIYNNDCEQRIVSLGGANIGLINNSIYHNTGQVSMGACFNIDIINNTIVNNSSNLAIWIGDNARIINSIIPEINISQDSYEIINSYVSEYVCQGDHCTGSLTEAPIFKNPLPYTGTGPLEEILQADYSLSNVSPGINWGTEDTTGLNIGNLDIAGNPRINDSRIDIGAYENQGSIPVITRQPAGGTFCIGDDHVLEIEYSGSDTVSFNWFKDGSEIIGQDGDNTLELDSILRADEGNYHCEISNSYGTVISAIVYVKVNVKPAILVQPENVWHETGTPLSLSVVYTGSSPIYFQWEKDGQEITGEKLPEYKFIPSDSSYEGAYVCAISNDCGSANTDPASLYIAPQLCMVTVSTTTGHNLVVWEKKTRAPIVAYNIYRESIAAGIYDLLASIPMDDLSVFVDTTADPTVQAYLYKITAVDTSGFETDIDLCKPHKTIHLLVTTNPELNTTQLAWDRYYGFVYQTYTIYRSTTGTNFDPVHSLSASLNSWTDPDPSTGDLFYRIAVEKPDPCVPEGGNKKAGTGPYVNSLSNMDDNKLKAGENPPDSIMLDRHDIDENLLPGSLVGRLSTRDMDTLDTYTYQLVPGAGDENNDSFTLIGDLLVSASTFDYETKNSYSIRIRTTDNAAFYLERAFVITVNDTQEGSTTTGETPPDSIYIDNLTIAENNNFGDPIGMLITADEDTSDVHTYLLASGDGDDDNIMFMITGNVLRAGFSFDYETRNSFSVRVRSTDLAGNKLDRVFIISITDVDETVGISNNPENDIRVYPNPFAEFATITFPNPGEEPFSMTLSDISGKMVRRMDNITSSEFFLRKADLNKGMYFLKLDGRKTYRIRIVID